VKAKFLNIKSANNNGRLSIGLATFNITEKNSNMEEIKNLITQGSTDQKQRNLT
jgi:hypothetical protein